MSTRQVSAKIMDESAVGEDVNSDAVDVRHLTSGSVQVEWTSTTASATFKVQARNDENATWVDVSGKTQAVSSDSGSTLISLADVVDRYAYVRVQLDWSSGSVTTAQAWLHAKNQG